MFNKLITPTVGRVVWYHPHPGDPQLGSFVGHPHSQPLAAIVVYVWGESMVNLTVHDPNGNTHARTSVPLWGGEGERPDHRNGAFAEWMPFQLGQAKKVNALKPD